MRNTPLNGGAAPPGLPAQRLYAGGNLLPAVQQARHVAVVPQALRPAAMTVDLPQQQAAELFRRIRQMSGLSLLQIAHRLHTKVSVIDALERGDVDLLPPWPETVVVVSGFTALAGVDPRPVLVALREGQTAKVLDARPVVTSVRGSGRPHIVPKHAVRRERAEPFRRVDGMRQSLSGAATRVQGLTAKVAPIAARAAAYAKLPSVRRPLRMPVAVSLAVTLPLALLVSFSGNGSLQAAVSELPAPLSQAVRKVEDYMLRTRAVEKDGMMWIEVSDPRSRKTDKLPSPRR